MKAGQKPQEKTEQKIKDLVAKVEESYNADGIVYCGPRKRPNALLMLTTTGGDAHAAYRIARSLRGQRGPEPTGLEPATSAVTGRRSNQLS
jgi:hypothetical protein